MTELEKLADRVEAEGPSRELDAAIALAAGWTLDEFNCTNINGATERGKLWFPPYFGEEDKAEAIADYRERVAVNMWPDSDPPAYTSSLDTAMMLAGDEIRHIEWCNGRVEAAVFVPGTAELRYGYAHVDYPAAALCAAALRANQENRNEQG